MHVQFVLALGRSRLTFREVHTKYFGNSGEGYVRLRPGSWEASKQGGDSAGPGPCGACRRSNISTGMAHGRVCRKVRLWHALYDQGLERERAQRDVFFLNYKGP